MAQKEFNTIHKESSQVRTKLNFDPKSEESSQRDAYAHQIAIEGERFENLTLLDADLMTVGKTHVFRDKFPDRHI